MLKFILFLFFPLQIAAQSSQDLFYSFPASSSILGSDSIKLWIHIPENYPSSGGGLMLGLHGLGEPNNSNEIRTFLTPTSDNYNLLLVCPQPYLSQENPTQIAKSKAVITETIDSILAWYSINQQKIYICGYSAGSDVSAHYVLENPKYSVKGFIWFAPGFYGSLLYSNIDTSQANPIPPICLCHGTSDLVSQTSAIRIENVFKNSSAPFLKINPQGIGHTMNYPNFSQDISTCLNFFISLNNTSTQKSQNPTLQVYPNPFSNELYIETQSNHSFQVEIYNLMGNLVHYERANKNYSRINLDQLLSGIYVLVIKNEEMIYQTHKLIKE